MPYSSDMAQCLNSNEGEIAPSHEKSTRPKVVYPLLLRQSAENSLPKVEREALSTSCLPTCLPSFDTNTRPEYLVAAVGSSLSALASSVGKQRASQLLTLSGWTVPIIGERVGPSSEVLGRR